MNLPKHNFKFNNYPLQNIILKIIENNEENEIINK